MPHATKEMLDEYVDIIREYEKERRDKFIKDLAKEIVNELELRRDL